MNLLKEKLGTISGGKILDIATESGDFIRKLIDAFKDYTEAIGIDISDEYFDKARKNLEGKRVSFREMDGANLLFNDETFDTVAMCAGLHHLPDINAVLGEMKRTLKPEGDLLFANSSAIIKTRNNYPMSIRIIGEQKSVVGREDSLSYVEKTGNYRHR